MSANDGECSAAAGPRLVLLGYMGAGNFGNEGSLDAMIAALMRTSPQARLTCAVADPGPVAARTSLPALPFDRPRFSQRWMRGLSRALLGMPSRLANAMSTLMVLRKQHAVVVPGTGILDDFGTGPRGMPSALLRWTVLARLCGVKVLFVSIGAGPIVNPRTRRLMRTAARLATFRSYRDPESKAFVASLGIDTSKDEVTPDVVFSLPPPASRAARSHDGPLTIGIGVINYHGWHYDPVRSAATQDAYVGKITAFALRLVDLGHNVRFLTGAEADWQVVERLRARISVARPDLASDRVASHRASNLTDVMNEAALCDIVIASRFHNVVCALIAARPVISIGYAAKNDQLLQEVGLDDCCQHIESLDIVRLEQQLSALLGRREAAAARIERVIGGYRTRLAEQEARIAGHIGAPRSATTRPLPDMSRDPASCRPRHP